MISGVGKVVGLILLIVFVVGGISAGVWAFRVATAPIVGAGNQRIEVNDADYRIEAYDRFFNLCSQVAADKQRISSLEQELEVADPDSDRREQIFASMTAIRNGIAENVEQYNVDAAKEGTRGQFRASELPYRLNAEGETSCVL